MEKKTIIQVYVKPDGTQVVRAFKLKDFIWYDEDGMIVALGTVLSNRLLAAQVGHHYEIQKKQNEQSNCDTESGQGLSATVCSRSIT